MMQALCFTRYGQGNSSEELADIITTATIKVLHKMQALDKINAEILSKTFYWCLRSTTGPYFRKKMRRAKILDQYINDIEKAAKILLKR